MPCSLSDHVFKARLLSFAIIVLHEEIVRYSEEANNNIIPPGWIILSEIASKHELPNNEVFMLECDHIL